MMIPKTIEAWQQDMWTMRHSGNFLIDIGNGTLNNFEYYLSDNDQTKCHELGHLVVVSDDKLFTPGWGCMTLRPQGQDYYDEVEVVVVEKIIKLHLEACRSTFVSSDSIEDRIGRARPIDITWASLQAHIDRSKKKWSIEKIWKEVERKYSLVMNTPY